MSSLATAPPTRLFTTWGTVLYVDADSGELRHGPIDSGPENAVFVADADVLPGRRQGWMVYNQGDTAKRILCTPEKGFAVAGVEGDDGLDTATLLELIPLERGLIAFTAEGRFLCAEPDGRVALARPWCSTWEWFLASEAWCGAPLADDTGQAETARNPGINWRGAKQYIIDARLRAKANSRSKATKILIYGYPAWSHGRVYYDVCKYLHKLGYIVDIINWQVNHSSYIGQLISYYDLFISALDGVQTLVQVYGVPCEKVIGLSHHEMDIRILLDKMGKGVFERFAGYGVVSYQLFDASVLFGIARHPLVVQLGVNFDEFRAEIPERLATVGYAGSYSHKTIDGLEWKRGDIAEAATREAGLEFKIAGWTGNQISFHDMPEFYKSVDAILVSSVTEGAGLPAMEAAAAGRLVISTPVGHFPLRAAQGLGVVAPIESHKYHKFVTETLRHYKDNPGAFVGMCRNAQNSARKLDWQYLIGDWVELIETAAAHRIEIARAHQPPGGVAETADMGGPIESILSNVAPIGPLRQGQSSIVATSPATLTTKASDVSSDILSIVERVRQFTMTSPERIVALCNAVEYVVRGEIPGDFVECGVWRGGSCMAAALTFLQLGRANVHLHLFDTFEGMTEPTQTDWELASGEAAASILARSDKAEAGVWAHATFEEVERNLSLTQYPRDKIHFVSGRVEDTLPQYAPEQISILRLDTDWYESTLHELRHLFPRLSVGGVLIIDDYGHWAGAKKAVDDFFAEHPVKILLNPIDYTGRIGVKSTTSALSTDRRDTQFSETTSLDPVAHSGLPFAVSGRADAVLSGPKSGLLHNARERAAVNSRYYLVTHHNTIAYVDTTSWHIRHAPFGTAPLNLELELVGHRGRLLVIGAPCSEICQVSFVESARSIRPQSGRGHLDCVIQTFDDDSIAIRIGEHYVTAELSASEQLVTNDRTWCQEWERFQLASTRTIQGLQALSQGSWLSHSDRRIISLPSRVTDLRQEFIFGPARVRLTGTDTHFAFGGSQFTNESNLSTVNIIDGHGRLYTFSRFSPLIYFCLYGDDSYYHCLRLALTSLATHASFAGAVGIACDRTREEISDYVPKSLQDRLILSNASRDRGWFNQYDLEHGLYDCHQPIVYCDVDIIFDTDLTNLLIDILLQQKICCATESFYPALSQSPPRTWHDGSTERYFGRQLYASDMDFYDSVVALGNAGVVGFDTITRGAEMNELVKAIAGKQSNEQLRTFSDQPIFDYVLNKRGLGDFETINKYCRFVRGEENVSTEGRRGLVHFIHTWTAAEKASLMHRYLEALDRFGEIEEGDTNDIVINLKIPGQISIKELERLGRLAQRVPPNGCIVEVGSLFGLSSWTLAKNAHPTVTVFCIDPWIREPWMSELERREGQLVSLDSFKANVADAPNIVPLPGYSPRDFMGWRRNVDLLFEDSVHNNPVLHDNLEFWTSVVRTGGVLCGHDYCDAWPDVKIEVDRLAKARAANIDVVETLWSVRV
jgi:hypothetical protein